MLEDRPDIVVLVPYSAYPADMGGRRSIAAFNEMLNNHFKVHLVTTNNSDQAPKFIKFYPVLGSTIGRYINPILFFRIKELMATIGSKKLVLIQPYFGWLAMLLKNFAGVQYFVKAENLEAFRFRDLGKWWWPIMKFYEGITLRGAARVFFISEEDRLLGVKKYRLAAGRCHLFSYGTHRRYAPSTEEKKKARSILSGRHGIDEAEKILLFNGTLDYQPNLNALLVILTELLPIWLKQGFKFRVLICGSNLPEEFKNLADYKDKNLSYAGFVKDIDTYFLGSDVFLNPVWEGGGIKTKLVDAIAACCSAVSTVTGAMGIPVNVVGEKLTLAADKNWIDFAKQVMEIDTTVPTPPSFYNYFNYDKNIRRVAEVINSS